MVVEVEEAPQKEPDADQEPPARSWAERAAATQAHSILSQAIAIAVAIAIALHITIAMARALSIAIAEYSNA